MFSDEDIFNHIGLGAQPFFSERSDDAKEYVIDESFIAELKEIRDNIYSSRDIDENRSPFALILDLD